MIRASRNHAGFWAFLLHRLSGLVLLLFLPLHFLALGLALQGETGLERFIRWSDNPWVKAAEWGLITLLAVHLTGGIRLLALEFLPWSERQKTWIALATGTAVLTGLAFLLNLV